MSDVKGYVYRVRPGHWQWQVLRDGKLIATDNTGSWRPVHDECRRVVEAFRTVERRRSRHEAEPRPPGMAGVPAHRGRVVTGCSLPHIALWVLTLPVRLVGWAVSLRPTLTHARLLLDWQHARKARR